MPTGSGTSLQNNLNGTDTKMSSEDLSGSNNGHSNGNTKLPTVSYDHTPYVQRARVTRPAPPKPSANPLQFVQIKPCNLYQSAQEQLKRAEEVKKVKEIKKEEPEDWQNNLDNWKSSRRKRVEHIIDRVVEVKKLELEEHDRTRRKSKTFSEMMEEKKTKRSTKLAALVYTEEESNDLSDLGIGTSSASGKSSLSEDYDNQSVMSDNVDNDKHSIDLDHPSQNHDETNGSTNRDYMSSPGYDTSSSTAPASSPDPCEYTYEGAIEDYKTRISKASQITTTYNNGFRSNTTSDSYSKDSTPERQTNSSSINHPPVVPARRTSAGTKIENRLMSFEIKSACDLQSDATNSVKKSLPKVDILKRRELFEKENSSSGIQTGDSEKRSSSDFSNSKSIKERLSNLEKIKVPAECGEDTKPTEPNRRLSGDLPTIRGRLQILEKQNSQAERKPKIEVPVGSLKDRLSSLHTAATKEEAKKPVMLIDARQLEILKEEDLIKQHQMGLLKANHRSQSPDIDSLHISHEILKMQEECNLDTDREDSGIHTTDVSCSVSQTDEQPELSNEESAHHINANDGLCDPEESVCLQLTTANPIPDEFVPVKPIPTARTHINTNILSETITVIEQPSAASPEPLNDLDASVNEALEIALQAIDSETVPNANMMEILSVTQQQPEPIYENITNDHQPEMQMASSSLKTDSMIPSSPAKLPQTPASSQVPVQFEKPTTSSDPEDDQEPYYQVPKSSEPYYEVPKYHNQRPVPVYENIEIFFPVSGTTGPLAAPLNSKTMEPPKEKPPPPPIDDDENEQGVDDELEHLKSASDIHAIDVPPMKRMNSTKRIKKELRNKRSSFLGIEGSNDDETYLELTVAPPPDMAQLLQEEKRLEKQLYMKAGLYDSSDTGESRDSGVSENHSRQSSEPFTNSSEEHEDLLVKKEKEIIEVLEKEEEKQRSASNLHLIASNNEQHQHCLDDHRQRGQLGSGEQDEILRVERELLQLEQEEMKRQRENLLLRASLARNELDHGAKMLMSANRRSMNDINSVVVPTITNSSIGHYANLPAPQNHRIYQVETDYRKSMSDLYDPRSRMQSQQQQQQLQHPMQPPPIPPAKPMRSNIIIDSRHSSGLVKIASPTRVVQHAQSIDELSPLRNYQLNTSPLHHGNMTRQSLHALSATPKPKFTDAWIQSKAASGNNSPWISSYQEKRRSVPDGFNCNKHWLVQEAEQRRIEQQRGLRNGTMTNGWTNGNGMGIVTPTKSAIQRNGSHDNKPLPEAIIQTLTQRVQSKGIGERRRFDPIPTSSSLSSTTSLLSISTPQLNQLNISNNSTISEEPSDKILSVSGKKKCSHCGEELGRGAAMIIESLRLFYHIDCFKCCVCHVQLSDGLNGTDVRVRNQKLHCQNCYSSDDGIKFSCV